MKAIMKKKLWGRIAELYGSQSAFAEALGCSRQSVNAVLVGKACLSQSKIESWCNVLGIAKDEIGQYFF